MFPRLVWTWLDPSSSQNIVFFLYFKGALFTTHTS